MAEQKSSRADDLLKLIDAKRQGELTEEEFAVAKAALLRGIQASAPPEPVTCKSCDGSKKCRRCDGDGTVSFGFKSGRGIWPVDDIRECPECHGGKACKPCGGKGSV